MNVCSRFEEKPFDFPANATIEQIMDLRFKHRIGTCQERAIVFLSKVKLHLDPHFVTLLTSNDIHIAPEIGNGSVLESIELGGSPGDIELLENTDLAVKKAPPVKRAPSPVKSPKTPPIKPKLTEQDLNPAFCTWKTEGTPLTVEMTCAELSTPASNIRLLLTDRDHDVWVIATFANYTNTPFLFIDTADDLQWHSSDLKLTRNRLKLKDNFSRIRHFINTHPEGGTIFINFNRFTPEETVALHCVLKERLLEGEAIPPQFTMVSLHSKSIPGVYQGQDFITRHNKVLAWSADYHQGIELFNNRRAENPEPSTENQIDLFNSPDWESILFRQIQIIAKKCSILPSTFLQGLTQNESPLPALHLINAPWHLREFQLFWQHALQRNCFTLYGREFNLGEHFQLSYSSKIALPVEVIQENPEQTSIQSYPINFTTFAELFDDYYYADHSMASYAGLLKEHEDRSLSLIIAADFPLTDWSRLLTTAQKLHVTLHLSRLPAIQLPAELAQIPIADYKVPMIELTQETLRESFHQQPYTVVVTPLSDQAQSPFTELLLKRYSEALYLAVDTCHDFGDLFYQINAKLKGKEIEASFKEGAVWRALQDKKTVIVEGKLSGQLIQALTPLFLSGKPEFRINKEEVPFEGQLFIVTDSRIPGACNQYKLEDVSWLELPSNNKPIEVTPASNEKNLHNQTDDLSSEASEAYLSQVFNRIQTGFEKSNIVALVGSTGIGKTTYLTEEFEREYHTRTGRKAKLYFDLVAFAQHQDPDVDPFYNHDEANLSSLPLALFKSLNCTGLRTPHLLKNGDYFPSSRHRVFLLLNPAKDGGARRQDTEFSFAAVIPFDRPNHAYFYHKILRPQLSSLVHLAENHCQTLANIIFAVFDKANDLLAIERGDFPFTPRHLHMIAVFFVHYCMNIEAMKLNEVDLAIAACFSIFGDSLPLQKKTKLLHYAEKHYQYDPRHFAQYQTASVAHKIKQCSVERPVAFAFTESRHGLLQILDTLLALRMTGRSHAGLQLEGEPAVGKTDVVKYYLALLGIKFHELTFSSNYQTVRDALLKIFHAGEIVIINEFTSGGALHERLLNTLIMGKDELGHKPDVPGFLPVVTCNSMALAGRSELSPALQARLLYYSPPTYKTEELFEILKLLERFAADYKLAPEQAKLAISQFTDALAFANEHRLNPKPNLRTLLDVVGVPTLRVPKATLKEDKGKEKVVENPREVVVASETIIREKIKEDRKADEPKVADSHDRQLDKEELIRKIKHKIKIYSYTRFNPFLASPVSKIEVLQLLLAEINSAPEGADLVAIVRAWEAKTRQYWHHGTVVTLSNRALLETHRNVFFATNRPGVKTKGELFLEQLLGEPSPSNGRGAT
jgi:hypothetical protein